jgi:hypothetical protein
MGIRQRPWNRGFLETVGTVGPGVRYALALVQERLVAVRIGVAHDLSRLVPNAVLPGDGIVLRRRAQDLAANDAEPQAGAVVNAKVRAEVLA